MANAIIEQLIPLADAHQRADEYVSGIYWEQLNGRGCAVGCTIHDGIALGVIPNTVSHDDHEQLAAATGVPEMLWRLADRIFEGLPAADRPAWTPRFLRAVNRCDDLSPVPARIMAKCARRLSDDAIRDDVKAVALVISGLWSRRASGDDPTDAEWDAAREQADAAREQADAAWMQAYAARMQADAAREQFWRWLADAVCNELNPQSQEQ